MNTDIRFDQLQPYYQDSNIHLWVKTYYSPPYSGSHPECSH